MTKKRVTPEINAISTLLFVTVLVLLVITNVREARQEQLAERRRRMPTATAAEAAQYSSRSRSYGRLPQIAGAAAVVVLIVGAIFVAGRNAGKPIVNVCSWGEYIDESLIEQFEEETGIMVNYQTAESNEALYSLLKSGAGDYDVVVPSDYMMMYGLGEFENGSASISFKHIPATFRFIITNKRPTTARLETVSLSVDGGASVGSNFAEVHGDYTTESLYVDFAGNHKSITTLLNTTLASQESYTAYAMALPLSDSETLNCKEIKFVINTEEHGFLSFVLTGSQIANANKSYGEDIYNWVSGKSYTIRMSLDDVLTFDGITVEDWNKETIDGGEAEEEI